MRLIRLEPLLIFIEKRAENLEANERIVEKAIQRLAAQKLYFDNINADKVKERLSSGEFSYAEYKVLRTVLEEKKQYEKNSEKLEEIINGKYFMANARGKAFGRRIAKALATAGLIGLAAFGVTSCVKKNNDTKGNKNEVIRGVDNNENNNNNNNNNTNNEKNTKY